MKLRANRPGRDIRFLLAMCDIRSLDAADDSYEEFYPGDGLDSRATMIVEAILAEGPPRLRDPSGPIVI